MHSVTGLTKRFINLSGYQEEHIAGGQILLLNSPAFSLGTNLTGRDQDLQIVRGTYELTSYQFWPTQQHQQQPKGEGLLWAFSP